MNKNIAVALVLAVAIGVAYLAFGPEQTAKNSEALQMSVVSVKDTSDKLYEIDAEYPQFAVLPAAFNAEISDFVNGNIADFKKTSAENWQARQATLLPGQPKQEFPDQPFYFDSNWEPEQLNGNYVSLIVRFAEYVGGANENQNLRTFNYDLLNHREMTLADLFPGVPDYLRKISDIVRSDLNSSLDAASQGHVQTDILNQGTAPTLDNFSNFVFNGTVVTFYFPKYQVAPGVFGEQYVPVLRSSVK